MSSSRASNKHSNDGEFLWLVSLSDLMILLFVFFVVLFSFSYRHLKQSDLEKMSKVLKGENTKTTMDEIQANLLKWVVKKDLLDEVNVKQKEDALILEIKEKLLFASGKFELKSESFETIRLLGLALEKIPAPYRIGIEGHTDDSPMKTKNYIKDNWELSVRRAHTVLQALKLKPETAKRTVIMGHGSNKPLAPNRNAEGIPSPENQAKNRRVTVRIF